jgi:uncharacterized protein (TIGR03067 family)
MLVKHLLKISALLLLLVGAPALVQGDDKALKGDLKSLQGTWVSEIGPESEWIFEDNNLKATVNGMFYQCLVTLDEKGKPQREINIKITGGAADGLGKQSKGIYKLDGETLKLCIGLPGEETRPTEFETEDGKYYAFELTKKK